MRKIGYVFLMSSALLAVDSFAAGVSADKAFSVYQNALAVLNGSESTIARERETRDMLDSQAVEIKGRALELQDRRRRSVKYLSVLRNPKAVALATFDSIVQTNSQLVSLCILKNPEGKTSEDVYSLLLREDGARRDQSPQYGMRHPGFQESAFERIPLSGAAEIYTVQEAWSGKSEFAGKRELLKGQMIERAIASIERSLSVADEQLGELNRELQELQAAPRAGDAYLREVAAIKSAYQNLANSLRASVPDQGKIASSRRVVEDLIPTLSERARVLIN